jgi:hypothetical protein
MGKCDPLTDQEILLFLKQNIAAAQQANDKMMKNNGTGKIFSPCRNFICK